MENEWNASSKKLKLLLTWQAWVPETRTQTGVALPKIYQDSKEGEYKYTLDRGKLNLMIKKFIDQLIWDKIS